MTTTTKTKKRDNSTNDPFANKKTKQKKLQQDDEEPKEKVQAAVANSSNGATIGSSRLEAIKNNKGFLQHFWDLSSLDAELRVKATRSLIADLKNATVGSDQQQQQSLGLEYTVKRLVRGVGSSREGSRQGFSAALTEVLRDFPESQFTSLEHVISLIQSELKVTGSAKAQEERDVLFGRLFSYLALVRSGRIGHSLSASPKKAPQLLKEINKMIIDLLKIADTKHFLQELSYQAVIQILQQVTTKDFQSSEVRETVKQKLEQRSFSDYTPELLSLSIAIFHHFGIFIPAKAEATDDSSTRNNDNTASSTSSYLQRVDIKHLVPCLKSSSYTHPKVHSVWELILKDVLPESASKKSSKEVLLLAKFWKEIVEDELFADGSSLNRKYLGFQLFESIFPRLESSSQIASVFTPKFFKCLLFSFSSQQSQLQIPAHQLVKLIEETGKKKKNTFKFGLALSLMGVNTSMFQLSSLMQKVPPLQQLTKQLLSQLTEEQTLSFFNELIEAFYSGDNLKETVDIEKYRLWCLDQICAFIRNGDIPKSEETIKRALQFIFAHTYYSYDSTSKQKKKAKNEKLDGDWSYLSRALAPPVSDTQRSLFSQRLFKLLFDLKKTNQLQVDWEGYLWQTRSAITSHTSFTPAAELTSESKSALKAAQSAIDNIDGRLESTSEKGVVKQLSAFKALMIHLSLSLLTNQNDSPLCDAVIELQHIYEVFFPNNTKKAANQQEGITELVDLLVSLLTRESVVLRNLVGRAFSAFVTRVDSSTLDILLQSINLSEEKNLFDTEDDEHGHDEEDLEGSDEDDESEDDESDDDDSDEGSSEDESADNDGKGDNSERKETGSDSEEEPDDSVLLDNVDEEDMMKLDSHLERHFRELKKHQKKQSETQQQAINFRRKIGSLLEIFIKKADQRLIIEQLIPFLFDEISKLDVHTASTSKSKAHVSLVSTLLTKITRKKEKLQADEIGEDSFRKLVDIGFKSLLGKIPAGFNDALHNFIFHLIKICLGREDTPDDAHSYEREVFQYVLKGLASYMTSKKTNVKPQFWTQLLTKFPEFSWGLVYPLIHYAQRGARNTFVRKHAFVLLCGLFQHPSIDSLPDVISKYVTVISDLLEDKAGATKPKLLIESIRGLDILVSQAKKNDLEDELNEQLSSKLMSRLKTLALNTPKDSKTLRSLSIKILKELQPDFQLETTGSEHTTAQSKVEKLRKTAEIAASHLLGLVNLQVARGLTSRDASIKNYSVANFDLKRKSTSSTQPKSKKLKQKQQR